MTRRNDLRPAIRLCLLSVGLSLAAGIPVSSQARDAVVASQARDPVVASPARDPLVSSPARDQAVAQIGQHQISASELERAVGNRLLQLRSQQYLMARTALDELISEYLLQEEARRQGLTTAELQAKFEATAKPVTPQEVRLVFEATRDRYVSLSEPEALKTVERSMVERRRAMTRRDAVRELRAKYGVRVLLEPPRVLVGIEGSPSRGPADAPVTLVEFSDYQCPFCARMAPTIKELQERFPKHLRVVFRDFPLGMHPQAPAAAEAAHCAGVQGRYWEMHDKLFANQKQLAPPLFEKLASEVGIDVAPFQRCLAEGQFAERVRRDEREGKAAGVTGTPAFFLNGRYFSGLVPLDVLVEAIQDEIAAAGAKTSRKSATPH